MKYIKGFLIALVMLNLTGCISTKIMVDKPYQSLASDKYSYSIIQEDTVPEKALVIVRDQLEKGLNSHFEKNENLSNKEIEIIFTNYYMRHGATRMLVGIMAGADSIVTTINIRDKTNKEILSTFTVKSGNPTAAGTAKGLLMQHVDKITHYITSGKA